MHKDREQKIEARGFAMNLLMPEDAFTHFFKEYNGDFEKLSQRFRVPVEICEVRAFNLGLITPREMLKTYMLGYIKQIQNLRTSVKKIWQQ